MISYEIRLFRKQLKEKTKQVQTLRPSALQVKTPCNASRLKQLNLGLQEIQAHEQCNESSIIAILSSFKDLMKQ